MDKDLLAKLKEERHALELTLSGVSVLDYERPLGQSKWSPKDILGHLTSWEELVAEGIEQVVRGEKPLALEVSANHEPFNQEQASLKKDYLLERIRAEFEKGRERLFEVLLDLPAPLSNNEQIRKMVQMVIDHDKAYREKIEAWKKQGRKPA